ncbi:MAG: hypothetical protein FWG31_05425 [Oscillospiraceae bacterium]|nr:hypothetical protein [Oscillospiraceae bacterium]
MEFLDTLANIASVIIAAVALYISWQIGRVQKPRIKIAPVTCRCFCCPKEDSYVAIVMMVVHNLSQCDFQLRHVSLEPKRPFNWLIKILPKKLTLQMRLPRNILYTQVSPNPLKINYEVDGNMWDIVPESSYADGVNLKKWTSNTFVFSFIRNREPHVYYQSLNPKFILSITYGAKTVRKTISMEKCDSISFEYPDIKITHPAGGRSE